jgi:hypothetical protein
MSTALMALLNAAEEAICWDAVAQVNVSNSFKQFQKSFKKVSKKFRKCFKTFQNVFEYVSKRFKMFQKCFKMFQMEKGGDEVGAAEQYAASREMTINKWLEKHADNKKDPTIAKAWKASSASVVKLPRTAAVKLIPEGLEVVVIGGGASGLKAAADLEAMGAKVTVVDARDRVGGRVWSYHLEGGGKAGTVDLGASFICGTSTVPPLNPLMVFAKKLKLKLSPKHRNGPNSNLCFDDEGQVGHGSEWGGIYFICFIT